MTADRLPKAAAAALSKPSPIRLRLDVVDRLCRGRGATNDSSAGRLIGVDPSLYGRVRRGEVAPGVTFLARVFAAFPEWPMDELVVVDLDNAGLLDEDRVSA